MPDITRKISAVMSLPRLMFTDNMTCISNAVISRGIPLHKQTGVFWGQCLTRLFEQESKKELDYILTIDYDSWFTFQDIISLMALFERHPEYDAIYPLQNKREDGLLLIGIKPKDGADSTTISKQYLSENEIIPADTGHFGLTLFRKSCFERLKKPWFIAKPDDNGTWGNGRYDEDIMFWNNFKESGLKLGFATRVKIGHLQLVVTYPDTLENDWKPIHKTVTEIEAKA
jgi:hypothetical protein